MVAIHVDTFVDIQNEILSRARFPRTTDTDADQTIINDVKGFINLRYELVAGEEKWRWRRKRRWLPIKAKHTTGTAAVTNGNREVTFTNASLTSDMLYRKFRVSNENTFYEIVSIDETAQTVKLSERYVGSTNATASYVIFKDSYGAWPDLEELDDTVNPEIASHQPRHIGPRIMRELVQRNPSMEGKVRYVTIDGETGFDAVPMGQFLMGYDFMGGQTLLTKKIVVFPHIADENHLLPIDYIRRITPLDADTDRPLMPREDRNILVFGGLADLLQTQKDNESSSIWEARFEQKLNSMKADFQDTDDKVRLVVEDTWHDDLERLLHPANADLGSLFDNVDY